MLLYNKLSRKEGPVIRGQRDSRGSLSPPTGNICRLSRSKYDMNCIEDKEREKMFRNGRKQP